APAATVASFSVAWVTTACASTKFERPTKAAVRIRTAAQCCRGSQNIDGRRLIEPVGRDQAPPTGGVLNGHGACVAIFRSKASGGKTRVATKPYDSRLAHWLVSPLRGTRVHPNFLTTLGLMSGLAAANLLATGRPASMNWGAAVFVLS